MSAARRGFIAESGLAWRQRVGTADEVRIVIGRPRGGEERHYRQRQQEHRGEPRQHLKGPSGRLRFVHALSFPHGSALFEFRLIIGMRGTSTGPTLCRVAILCETSPLVLSVHSILVPLPAREGEPECGERGTADRMERPARGTKKIRNLNVHSGVRRGADLGKFLF